MRRYRATGISGLGVGVQWERKDDDREIARRVLNLLADRRLLWKDFTYEIEEHCVQSAMEVRHKLGEHLDNPEISSDLAKKLQLLQGTFRSFIDEVGPHYDDRPHRHWGEGIDRLSMALGQLRALVGLQVGDLAANYDLDVSDDLATIVPDQVGWFFEKFDADN